MKSNLFIVFAAAYLLTGCTGPISERHYKEPMDLRYYSDEGNKLIKMAEKKFGKLTEADKILFTAVAFGTLADYTEVNDTNDLKDANSWGGKRVIKATRIEWLCHDREAKKLVSDVGIIIKGAKIEEVVNLDFIEIPFPLTFEKCVFTEEIRIGCSKIKLLVLDGSHTNSIKADGIKAEDCVYLQNGFKAEGEVRFIGATIGGDFSCVDGEFINEGGIAIFADRMDVKGTVFLRDGFKAEGEVRFQGATIGGNFDCVKGEFINKNGGALFAERMDVKGGVCLAKGFKAEGGVSFIGAIVGGHFIWTDVNLTEETTLDLRNARAGVLWDDEKSWPADGNLFLDGFVYENIGDDAPKDAKSRIEWIQKQYDPNKKAPQFRPQPYEQLATALQKSGYENDVKQVLISKNKDRIKYGPKLTFSEFLWYRIFGLIIGYGYDPLNALKYIVVIIVLGFAVFWGGHKAGVIVQVEEKPYHKFTAWVYSLDMFVPVLDLRMAKYWIPDANKRWGAVVRWYMWLHISAGWILTTLLIVGLTGLIKK
jgi:sRNA-binding regulator protein Hfq